MMGNLHVNLACDVKPCSPISLEMKYQGTDASVCIKITMQQTLNISTNTCIYWTEQRWTVLLQDTDTAKTPDLHNGLTRN